MQRTLTWSAICAAAVAVVTCGGPVGADRVYAASADDGVTQGMLLRLDEEGLPGSVCPLEHTDVNAEISGFLARVRVTQKFKNPLTEAIEAVYVFPLPQEAAVDDMTMRIGDRTVHGKIKEREEARQIYEDAKRHGNLASLLDQERPNIFTQAVANIPPGAEVEIEISYVETLPYEEGSYEFSFPMVVGPRYIPGSATGHNGGGWAPDTDQVSDASRITPPVARPGTRAGHDISIAVSLDAGTPVREITSKSHEVDVTRQGEGRARIELRNRAVLPNKDFILSYAVAGDRVEDALLTHHDERGGFFTFVLQPPERFTQEDVTPKELVFVLDSSGSMSGFPIEKAKEVIHLALEGLYPRDTFNLITFAGDTHVLFPEPMPATTQYIRQAQEFLESRSGGGGTEMMKAIRTALAPSDSQEHLRIVCFLTDGYVGNDMEILGEIQRHPNARVFSFGIGNSVNRFLLDKMAEAGRGAAEYVTLNDDGSAAARQFHERVRNPLLTDVSVQWDGVRVSDVYPARVPDLFSATPIVLSGRYDPPSTGTLRITGMMSGREWSREVALTLPAVEPAHDVLATLWARHRVDALMVSDWSGMQSGSPRAEVREEITQLGLDYRLMTQFTSFVAVEETVVTEGGVTRRIDVPVEMPEGVSYEGVFGDRAKVMAAPASTVSFAARSGGGMGGGIRRSMGQATAPPPPVRNEVREVDAVTRSDDSAKLQSELRSLAAGGAPGRLLVADGKVEVEIWLADASDDALDQLKQLGFEVTVEGRFARVIIGRLPVAQLEAAAALADVTYIAPHR